MLAMERALEELEEARAENERLRAHVHAMGGDPLGADAVVNLFSDDSCSEGLAQPEDAGVVSDSDGVPEPASASDVGERGVQLVINALGEAGVHACRSSSSDDREGRDMKIFRAGEGSGFMNAQVKTGTARPNFSCRDRCNFMAYKTAVCDLIIFVVLEVSEFFVIPLYEPHPPSFLPLLDTDHINRTLSEFREIFSDYGMHARDSSELKGIILNVFDMSHNQAARQLKRTTETRSTAKKIVEGRDIPMTGKGDKRQRIL